MTMLREFPEPNAREAEENLRIIRSLMERSTKYSTFSGLSGVLAGVASIIGCFVTYALDPRNSQAASPVTGVTLTPTPDDYRIPFLVTWTCVILFALISDYLLTKRRAATVGKHILSRLGKQMFIAAAPGLGTGTLLTLYFLKHHHLSDIYPVWMLCYGIAVCAVGLFSQREVTYLGTAFLISGAFTLLFPAFGLPMMAITFGGFHILYGILISRKDGW